MSLRTRPWRVAPDIRRLAVVATCAALAGGVDGAVQERQPTFRGGAVFVTADVYPQRDGRILEGLTAADFDVLEDGRPQKVERVEFVRVAANLAEAARRGDEGRGFASFRVIP